MHCDCKELDWLPQLSHGGSTKYQQKVWNIQTETLVLIGLLISCEQSWVKDLYIKSVIAKAAAGQNVMKK